MVTEYGTDNLCWCSWLSGSTYITKYGSTKPESGQPCCSIQKDKGACNRKGSGSASRLFQDELNPWEIQVNKP